MNRLRKITIGEFSIKRVIWSILLIPVLVYIGLLVLAHFYAERLIFQAQPASYSDTNEILKLKVGDGESISAHYLKNRDSRYTILFNHGNAEDIGRSQETMERLKAAGFSVLSYDYRGYGTSSGHASEENVYQDADAAYRYLVDDLKIGPEKIILWGRSLGGAVAVDLASKRKVGGLVVESSFVTAFRVLTNIPLFPIDKFDNVSKIENVQCPVLVIHGTHDEMIPLWHGEKLFEKARGPKLSLWVEGAGHNDLSLVVGDLYEKKLIEFVALLESQ